MQETSTKPYLLRALYEWCTDNGYTPHIAVRVDNRTRVPRQFVRDNEIVLNISFQATSQLQMGNDLIEFNARFSGKSHKIEVPVANVLAIYARENGQGMAFPVDAPAGGGADAVLSSEEEDVLDEVPAGNGEQGAAAGVEARDPDVAETGEGPGPNNGDDGGKGGRGHLKVVK
jgi:stringent starvation protein B